MSNLLIWAIAGATIAGILFRPRDWPEALWACLGAALLIVSGSIPIAAAGSAILRGTDVYLFLTGMMLLADLARREGVFDWLASLAVRSERMSSRGPIVDAIGIAFVRRAIQPTSGRW